MSMFPLSFPITFDMDIVLSVIFEDKNIKKTGNNQNYLDYIVVIACIINMEP